MTSDRFLAVAGGLCGAAGVALSAMAAHVAGANVGAAAAMLLGHAPALLAIGLIGGSRAMVVGGWVILAGALLFSSDMLMRQTVSMALFGEAAPFGGLLMIAGWLTVAVGAALASKR